MASQEGNNDAELTSTMGNLIPSNKDEGEANDSIPTSSTDASTILPPSYNVSEDPISSTSSDPTIELQTSSLIFEENTPSPLVTEKEMIEMKISDQSREKNTDENIDDVVQDLEILLNETPDFGPKSDHTSAKSSGSRANLEDFEEEMAKDNLIEDTQQLKNLASLEVIDDKTAEVEPKTPSYCRSPGNNSQNPEEQIAYNDSKNLENVEKSDPISAEVNTALVEAPCDVSMGNIDEHTKPEESVGLEQYEKNPNEDEMKMEIEENVEEKVSEATDVQTSTKTDPENHSNVEILAEPVELKVTRPQISELSDPLMGASLDGTSPVPPVESASDIKTNEAPVAIVTDILPVEHCTKAGDEEDPTSISTIEQEDTNVAPNSELETSKPVDFQLDTCLNEDNDVVMTVEENTVSNVHIEPMGSSETCLKEESDAIMTIIENTDTNTHSELGESTETPEIDENATPGQGSKDVDLKENQEDEKLEATVLNTMSASEPGAVSVRDLIMEDQEMREVEDKNVVLSETPVGDLPQTEPVNAIVDQESVFKEARERKDTDHVVLNEIIEPDISVKKNLEPEQMEEDITDKIREQSIEKVDSLKNSEDELQQNEMLVEESKETSLIQNLGEERNEDSMKELIDEESEEISRKTKVELEQNVKDQSLKEKTEELDPITESEVQLEKNTDDKIVEEESNPQTNSEAPLQQNIDKIVEDESNLQTNSEAQLEKNLEDKLVDEVSNSHTQLEAQLEPNATEEILKEDNEEIGLSMNFMEETTDLTAPPSDLSQSSIETTPTIAKPENFVEESSQINLNKVTEDLPQETPVVVPEALNNEEQKATDSLEVPTEEEKPEAVTVPHVPKQAPAQSFPEENLETKEDVIEESDQSLIVETPDKLKEIVEEGLEAITAIEGSYLEQLPGQPSSSTSTQNEDEDTEHLKGSNSFLVDEVNIPREDPGTNVASMEALLIQAAQEASRPVEETLVDSSTNPEENVTKLNVDDFGMNAQLLSAVSSLAEDTKPGSRNTESPSSSTLPEENTSIESDVQSALIEKDKKAPLIISIDDEDKSEERKTAKDPKRDDEEKESKGSLKMTITKQCNTMHSILKIYNPDDESSNFDDNSTEQTVPKLVIKPIVEQQQSPKMSVKNYKGIYSPGSSISPRITIKPIPKPEDPVSPLKITIKPFKGDDLNRQKHSPKLTIKPITRLDDDGGGEVRSNSPRVTIKPIVKPVEEEQIMSPRITIKPIVKPDEQVQTPPRVTIKPVVKPKDDNVAESSSFSPKITFKPLKQPQESEVDDADDTAKERIVLKINKGNLPNKETRKDEEKISKIKLKFSKEGGHPHIVQDEVPAKRARLETLPGITLTPVPAAHSKLKEMLNKTAKSSIVTIDDDEDDDITILDEDDEKSSRTSPIVISEESNQDALSVTFDMSDPLSDIPVFEITPQSVKTLNVVPAVVDVPPVQPPAPRKRGRPRKVPLVVREEYKEEEPKPAYESTRPKRSCRGPSVRTTLGIKPRKPRGPGRGRGGKRGMGSRAVEAKEPKLTIKQQLSLLSEVKPIPEVDEGIYKSPTQNLLAPPPSNDSLTDRGANIVMFEEETRMSTETNNSSRAQTPAKQVVTSVTDVVEESQSSVQSTATTESFKVKKGPRLEVHQEPEGAVISADQLAEYYWVGGGPYMLQEQVAQFLGIKSFKRKYPNIQRRVVDMQERDFIRESGLAGEAMCDLGLTAVNSADILDIMYSDFQDKYEEYCKHQRDRQAKDLTNKQKALSLAASQEKTKIDITQQAVQSAANWNATFNKARREQRKACMDLQTLTAHYPKGKIKQINRAKVGHYPVALVPGQFTDFYMELSPVEISNLPLNTISSEYMVKSIVRDLDCESQSDGSGSESDTSTSDSDTSYSGSSDENCTICKPAVRKIAVS